MRKLIVLLLATGSVALAQQKPKFVTVSVDSVQKQLTGIKGEFDYLNQFITEQEKVITEANTKIGQAKDRQKFLNGAANGLQAVLSDTTLHKRGK